MEITVISEEENPMLHRTDVRFRVSHAEATPDRLAVRDSLAARLNKNADEVIIRDLRTRFGMRETLGEAKVYQGPDFAADVEQDYMLTRNKIGEDVEADAEAEAEPAEAETEPAEGEAEPAEEAEEPAVQPEDATDEESEAEAAADEETEAASGDEPSEADAEEAADEPTGDDEPDADEAEASDEDEETEE